MRRSHPENMHQVNCPMLGTTRLIVITESDLSSVNPARLPPTMRRLVLVIGIAETLRLTCHFGGVRVSLGTSRQPKTKLRKAISDESISALAKHLDSEHIDIPKADSILSQIRDANIRDQAERGATLSDLTQEFGLTRRRVISICGQKKGK